MVARRGASTLGCLFPLLIAAAAIYFGKDYVQAYVTNYRFADAMRQEVHFGNASNDEKIMTHFRALADSLDLPRNAGFVRISHTPDGTVIWSDYDVILQFPFNKEKTIHFHPSSETSF